MKKTIITIALMMGVSGATIANNHMKIVNVATVSEAADLNLKALSGLKFVLSASKVEQRTVISLVNAENQTLFSEYADTVGNYAKVFDLSNLADGKYTFVVKSGDVKTEKTLEIKTSVERSVILN